jgi:hypothetical protein
MGKKDQIINAKLQMVHDSQTGEWLPFPAWAETFGAYLERYDIPTGGFVMVWLSGPKIRTSYRVAVRFESDGSCLGVIDYGDIARLGAKQKGDWLYKI